MFDLLTRKIHDPAFIAAHRTDPRHFTRNRRITFPVLIGFLLGAFKGNLQSLLNDFLGLLTGVEGQLAGRSALSQARYKLLASAFTELNQLVLDWLAEHLPEPRWYGFRLVAADGTTLHLPDSAWMTQAFGVTHDVHGNRFVMGRAVGLFAVTGRRLLRAELDTYETDERSLLLRCLDALASGDLLLLDRGFPARWLFAELIRRGIAFCIRADGSRMAEVKSFLRTGQSDRRVTLKPSAQDRRRAAGHGIELASDPVTIRLVRVSLPNGRSEVLITSLLDTLAYPAGYFGPLYHQRWRIEECFKTLKARLQIEQFTGVHPEAVEQDLQARVLLLNLTAALCQTAEASLPETKQGRFQVIFSFALSHLRWKLGDWLARGLQPEALAAALEVLAKNLNWLRPPRSEPRNRRSAATRSRMGYR